MANSASTPIRFEAGGIMTASDGTTTYTLVAIEPGTLEYEWGHYEPLQWTDRGVLQQPYEGDQRPGRLRISFKYTGGADADDLETFFTARELSGGNPTGKMKMYTIVIKIPDTKGGTSYDQATYSNCFLEAGGCRIKAGREFDMLDISLMHNAAAPAWTNV